MSNHASPAVSGTVGAVVCRRHTIEDRSSPVCMGVQRRIVSRDGHTGPWVCGKMAEVWKAYTRMRKAANTGDQVSSEAR